MDLYSNPRKCHAHWKDTFALLSSLREVQIKINAWFFASPRVRQLEHWCYFSQGVPVGIVLVFHSLNAAVVIKAAKFHCIRRGFLCSLPSWKKSREITPLLAGQEEG